MPDIVTHPLGENPISSDKPAGDNVRYQPEFEQLQAEVSKLENPAGGDVRWHFVVDLSLRILETKSKDLLVAAYFAYGMLQQQGYPGLLEGLGAIHSMCSRHWDGGMFPDRPRARESALDWLADRVQTYLDNGNPGNLAEAPVLLSAVATMDAIAQFVNAKFETQNPKLSAMSRALAARAAQGAADGTTTSPAAEAGKRSPMVVTAAGGPITNRKAAFERLKEVAEFLRRTEPHSPVSYLVNRAVKWGEMPLENVLGELVKNKDERLRIMETLGLGEER